VLFNGHEDPLEMRNLYYRNEPAGTIKRLRQRIEQWQRRVGDRQALLA
jgi:hypothetical protein